MFGLMVVTLSFASNEILGGTPMYKMELLCLQRGCISATPCPCALPTFQYSLKITGLGYERNSENSVSYD